MVHQWGFFGSISAIRKIWSLTANSRSLQAAALKIFQFEIFLWCEILNWLFPPKEIIQCYPQNEKEAIL